MNDSQRGGDAPSDHERRMRLTIHLSRRFADEKGVIRDNAVWAVAA
ncbi:hypothetical protein [Crateriforma conspicua]|uniref:Uncharacterized protein n=1 Tax=Crateriforma conspicua TaxID=2527996 RepID=A0A5C5Y8N5_9PLAN|nr:hypothetical protein [Crateriforma conspicua]QDV65868.1 hypothetical protein Mal65_50410 [Crateriforma conspicua]TWT71268.1 hypothetical protein Pan14r_35780 [Crateriforma conspicua]